MGQRQSAHIKALRKTRATPNRQMRLTQILFLTMGAEVVAMGLKTEFSVGGHTQRNGNMQSL